MIQWFERNARNLPWRMQTSPYAVWISEIMLQQTRVATVIPYFERWMQAFPDIEALAAAEEAQVLSLWQGLGYYARARNLHRCAQQVAAQGATFPKHRDALLKLPGIGPYTAGAIASIAFGERAAIVDGNVMRVFARLFAIDLPLRTREADRTFWSLAEEWADHPQPGLANQALMELGALICTPRAPRCDMCPISRHCAAHAAGRSTELPRPARRKQPRKEKRWAWIVRSTDTQELLLAQRSRDGLLGGLWEPPLLDREGRTPALHSWSKLLGSVTPPVRPLEGLQVQHVFTHIRMECTLQHLHIPRVQGDALPDRIRALSRYDDARWVSVSEMETLPLSTLARKLLESEAPTPERVATDQQLS